MTNNMDWKKIGYNMGYLRKIAEAKAETPEQEAKETPAHEAAETPAQEAAEHAAGPKPASTAVPPEKPGLFGRLRSIDDDYIKAPIMDRLPMGSAHKQRVADKLATILKSITGGQAR